MSPIKPYKVCLINPPVLTVMEPWYDTPDFGRTGLAYLAAYLRQYEGFDVTIVDAKFERLTFDELTKRVSVLNPHVIGFTAFTNEIKPAAYAAGLLKSRLPDTIFIVGGPHVTAIPEDTLLEFPVFDIGVVGEGEVTLYETCEQLRVKEGRVSQELSRVNGLVYRLENQVVQTPPRERILDQDSIPFPAWDLLPPAKTYYVQSMRGCPFNCIFCMNPNGKVARKRSVGNVMQELNWIIKTFKPERISFGDELFSVDMQRTQVLLDAMALAKIGDSVRWDVQTHVHYVNEDLFKAFKKANVERVELGVETGDEDMLRKMGKSTNLQLIIRAFQAAKKEGVKTGSFFLFGQPNETVESIEKTISLAVAINPDLPMFGLMTPYPGTEVSKMAAKNEGGYKILSTDWDEYNKQIGGALAFASLTRRQIEWLQIKAYIKVYLYNLRLLDLLFFVWEYRHAAFEVFAKIIFNRPSAVKHNLKPKGYDEYFRTNGAPFSKENFEEARDKWNDLQRSDLRRANLARHKERMSS